MKAINPSELWKKRLGDWVLNPYIGCEHGCKHCYCPAMPGVKFFNRGATQREWGEYLYPKEGLIEALRAQLRSFTPDQAKRSNWGDGWILMSFLTDCYTPAEAKHKLTRECLKLLLDAGHKVRLQTRSALVERDFDILCANSDRVLLGTSLPHLDDKLARVLEPRASSPTRRLRMLERARDRGLQVYVAVAPVLPSIAPIAAELCELVDQVEGFEPQEIFCEVLNPKGDNVSMMIDALAARKQSEHGRDPCRGCDVAAGLTVYDGHNWAQFTFDTLTVLATHVASKHRSATRFIAWPDTMRAWRHHLEPEPVSWLEKWMPGPADGPK